MRAVLPICLLLVALPGCGDDTSSSPASLAARGSGGTSATGGSAGQGGSAGSGATGGASTGGTAGIAGSGGQGGATIEDAPSTTHTFGDDETVFENPERGFYSAVNMLQESSLD